MASIKLSPRFFQTEKQNYSCPSSAVIRELIQNSVDAGSRVIELKTTETSLSCKDDGCGMSKEIILSKFLTLGQTGKEDGISIGGFARAKNLICFAQESYSISSHDYKVCGIGGDFDIIDNNWTKGCLFEIETEKTDWPYHIRKILNNCNLRQRVTVNGEEFKFELNRGRKVRELSFGDVWVNKSAPQKRIIIRVGGVIMFQRYCECAQIVVEIYPEISREVLLSNRDSLVYEKQRELDEFVNELASESISALKPKRNQYVKFMKKGVAFQSRKEVQAAAFTKEFTAQELISSYYAKRSDEATETVKEENWLSAAVLVVDSYCPIVQKAAQFYDPEKWTSGNETRMKLLKVWKTILDYVTKKYTERTGNSFNWGIGWIFSEDCAAQCRAEDGIEYLLLNPLGEDKKMKYSVSKRESFSELLVIAAHEVSHVGTKAHTESFASAFTYLMMDCLKDEAELWQKVRGCK